MAELATLGIEAKTTGVDQASSKLEKLTGAAKRAEAAVEGIGPASSKAGQMASQAANATATALNAEAAAATKAAGAMGKHAQAANQNARGAGAAAGNVSNLAAQFQDVAVSAAGGMSPLQIALQQGTQISAVLGPMGAAGALRLLGEAFLSVTSIVSIATIGIIALVAAGLQAVNWSKLAAGAMVMLANSLQTIAPYAVAAAAALALLYAPTIIGGVVQLIALLGRLSVAAITLAASFAAANPALAFVIGITAAVAAANIFRDELSEIFGRDIVADAKKAVNFVIGAFVGGFNAIKASWSLLPAALGDLVYQAANATIAGVESMVNAIGGKIDGFIGKINDTISSLPWGVGDGIKISPVGGFDFGRVANPYAGGASDAMSAAKGAATSAMGTDYVGGFGEVIAKGASAASAKLKELAKDLTNVDEKSKKGGKGKGSGGKSAAESYQDIVDAANRRIASLQAEQDALGLTEQKSAAMRYEQDMLNAAQRAGITLTAAQKDELHGLAERMGSIEAATKSAKEALDFAKDATKGFISDLRSGLENGEGFFKSFGKAALNVLDKIIGKIEDQLVDALFSASSAGSGAGGGGFLGSIFSGIGKIFGFASGGYTGKGAAHQAAGIVHGGEYVFSKKATDRLGIGNLDRMHKSAKGYSGGGSVTPVAANTNGGGTIIVRTVNEVQNGNLVPVMTEVAGNIAGQQIKQASPKIVGAAVNQSAKNVVPTMAQYQSQRAGGDYRT